MKVFTLLQKFSQYAAFIVYLVAAHTVEAQPSQGTMTPRTSVFTTADCYNYYEYLPPGYNDAGNAGKKYPLIVFLPGASQMLSWGQESNSAEAAKLLQEGLPKNIWNNQFPAYVTVGGTTYSFIVIAIQCRWSSFAPEIDPYLDFILSHYRVDRSRVYMTGLSKGGGITWEYAGLSASTANKLSAIVPISAGTDLISGTAPFNTAVNSIAGNAEIGVWAVHNLTDPLPYTGSGNLVDAINAHNPPPVKTARLKLNASAPNGLDQHDAWTLAYDATQDFTGTGLNLFQWMLTNVKASLLPVTLTRFDAKEQNPRKVLLEWSTASESKSSYFAVERSSNGIDFIQTGTVKAAGNSSVTRIYSFTDAAPSQGINYYRLKSVDIDHGFEYSPTREIEFKGENSSIRVMPNPFSTEIFLHAEGKYASPLQVTLYDFTGRTAMTMSLPAAASGLHQRISLDKLSPGLYLLNVRGENVNYSTKLLKR